MAERTALVVAGAGARGAYEAGALSTLLPAMARDGATPTLLFGTSAGALNVAALAAFANETPEAATGKLIDLWRSVKLNQVASVPKSLIGDGVQTLGLFFGGHPKVRSLLDTRRLARTVEPLIPWAQLHDNVRNGPVDAVAVAATSAATQGTVVFVEKKASVPLPPPDTARDIVYVETELNVEHVLASSAIPVAFRAVEVTTPAAQQGWYLDGGTRLNVPIKPALAFGADRVAVVSTHPDTYPAATHRGGAEPDIASAAAHLLRAALSDSMIEDLHTLQTVNRLVAQGAHAPYRRVRFLFAGPSEDERNAIAEVAEDAFDRQLHGFGAAVRNPGLWFLSRLIGGSAVDHGDLLSYLYFDPAFTGPAAQLGAQHAEAAVGEQPAWRL